MTTKDIAILLTPVMMFLTLIGGALIVADLMHRRVQSGDSHEKFESFVQDVESGKRQLTTDEWLEHAKLQQATAAAYLEVDTHMRNLTLWVVVAALLGIIFQIAALIHVRKRLQGRMPMSTGR